jgi:hypothetical protein
MRNSVQSKIPRNSAAFRDTEFRIIPRNFRQFHMAYGIYGSNKNVRNSVLTEFRGHPTTTMGKKMFTFDEIEIPMKFYSSIVEISLFRFPEISIS